ncbi:MAG: glycosyltransferase, partial [Candidatus Methylumidiphilus sp.]
MPRLSIIIPTLNEADGIANLLTSLSPLRQRGHEVIVADGGSHDGTVGLARPLADLAIDAPRGRAAQMNAGAAQAKAEVLLFLHADTRLPERADELILEQLAMGVWVEGNAVNTLLLPHEGRLGRGRLTGSEVSDPTRPHPNPPPWGEGTLELNSAARVWGRFDVMIEGTHPLLPVIAWMMNR